MTVTVYKSNDTSAPLLTTELGSITNLLKAVLVDGYGATPGAGWTVELEDAPTGRIIFKNSTGKMFWVKHDEYSTTDNTTDGLFRYAHIIGLDAYLDINVESLQGAYPNNRNSQFPDLAIVNAQAPTLYFTQGTNLTGIKWVIVADEKTCYFIPQLLSYNDGNGLDPKPVSYNVSDIYYHKMYMFGDYKSPYTDANGFVGGLLPVASSNYASYYVSRNIIPTVAANCGWIQRQPNGKVGAVEFNSHNNHPSYVMLNHGGYNYNVNDTSNYFADYPLVGGGVSIYPMDVFMLTDSVEVADKTINPIVGQFYGLYVLEHTISPSVTNPIGEWGDTFTLNGRQYILMTAALSANQQAYTIAFDLTGWD